MKNIRILQAASLFFLFFATLSCAFAAAPTITVTAVLSKTGVYVNEPFTLTVTAEESGSMDRATVL